MNENINLCEILKGHEGETFYSPIFGNLTVVCTIYPNVRFKTNIDYIWDINLNGKLYNDSDELCVFPSKDQKDWNKWVEEQRNKIPKIWSEYIKIVSPEIKNDYKDYPFVVQSKIFRCTDVTLIEKSALALIKINQLIDKGYGGNVTNEEWKSNKTKYTIKYHSDINDFNITFTVHHVFVIAFHTKEQAEEFLSYPDNVKLLKDYFMV